MHLGGLNLLMRCHEQRKVRNLTARFKASTPFETSSSSYTKKVSVPGRSCGCIGKNIDVYKPSWNPFSLGMEGGEMIWVVFFCCIRAYTLAPCLHNCFRMSTRNGNGAYAGVFLDCVPTRVPPQGSLLDGHVLCKWWNICPRDSAYARKIYIASARAYARLHGLWNIRSSAYAAL